MIFNEIKSSSLGLEIKRYQTPTMECQKIVKIITISWSNNFLLFYPSFLVPFSFLLFVFFHLPISLKKFGDKNFVAWCDFY